MPVLTLGTTGGDAVEVAYGIDAFTLTLDDAREAHEGTLPALFG